VKKYLLTVAALVAALCNFSHGELARGQIAPWSSQFQVDPFWPKPLPNDWVTGNVGGTCVDKNDHVFIVTRTADPANLTAAEKEVGRAAPPVIEFDAEGNVVNSWGDAKIFPSGAHDCYFDPEGNIWIGGNNDAIAQKYSRDGKLLLQIGTKGKFDSADGSDKAAGLNASQTLLNKPASFAVDPANGDIYIADGYGNRRIIVFDGATGKYLRHWGAYGKPPVDPPARPAGAGGQGAQGGRGTPDMTVPAAAPTQFAIPHGIVGSRDGLIYLADRANNRVQVFRQSGEFVKEKILRPKCGGEEKATWTPKRPCGIEAAFSLGFSHDTPQSYLYVADGGTHVITVLRRSDLEVVDEFGGPGVGPGQMGRPHNLTVDPSGNIFIAEAAGPSVKNPTTGAAVDAGFRAQKFTFTGTKPSK
jgi:DNA-binding beta-propeller fold protein YncE